MTKNVADIAWLAGIVDGEGCFSVKRPIARGDGGPGRSPYQVWLVVCNTSKPMVDKIVKILADLEISHQPVRRVWKGSKATRWQFWIHVARKDQLLRLTQILLPYLVAKHDEATVVEWFLSRSCQARAYKQTSIDKQVLDTLAVMKRNGGEAPTEIREFLREVIPSQASFGQLPKVVELEGVETRSVSPNNNPIHECPAPSVEGDDIVRYSN